MAQPLKKKTVKDLNIDVVNLAKKFKDFEELLKRITILTDIKDLEEKIVALNENDEFNRKVKTLEEVVLKHTNILNDLKKENTKKIADESFQCIVCNKKFGTREEIKAHKKKSHPKQSKCNYCEEVFDQSHKLEKHLETHKKKDLKCKICSKEFYLEWRLKKHTLSHEQTSIKYCHYFNNDKVCPYEEIGCMFRHEKSKPCKFNEFCKNKLCPFQHNLRKESIDQTAKQVPKNGKTNVDDLDMSKQTESQPINPVRISCKVCFRWVKDESDLENHMVNEHNIESCSESEDSEFEAEDLECDDCGLVSIDFDAYIEHRGRGDCVLYCNFCDKTFKDEKDLEKHIAKHCVNCCKEFSTQKLHDAHKKKCRVKST